MKKRWLFVPLAVGLLALAITGGAALAQSSGASGDTPAKSFAARVATILGLDQAKVQDAMKQARKDMQDEALQNKLDQMVKNGRLTQDQADQLKKWYQSRPDVVAPGLPFGGRGFHGGRMHYGQMGGGLGWGGFGWDAPASTSTPNSGTSGTSF